MHVNFIIYSWKTFLWKRGHPKSGSTTKYTTVTKISILSHVPKGFNFDLVLKSVFSYWRLHRFIIIIKWTHCEKLLEGTVGYFFQNSAMYIYMKQFIFIELQQGLFSFNKNIYLTSRSISSKKNIPSTSMRKVMSCGTNIFI